MSRICADDVAQLIALHKWLDAANAAEPEHADGPLVFDLAGPFDHASVYACGIHRSHMLHARPARAGWGPTLGDAIRAALEEPTP